MSVKNNKIPQSVELDFEKRKEVFEAQIKRFVDNGYVEILYQDDYFAISNYCNQCYLLFPYSYTNEHAIVVNKANVIYCIENFLGYMTQLSEWPAEKYNKNAVIINDKLFEHARLTKANTEKNGPSDYVDFEVEEYVKKWHGVKK